VSVGHADVVRLLLEVQSAAAAAVPDSKDHHLSSARQRRLQSPLTPVHWAAAGAHHDCMELLLQRSEWRQVADRPTTERRAVGDFCAPAGATPLMLAARAGSREVVRQIVDSVGDLLVSDRQDEHGN